MFLFIFKKRTSDAPSLAGMFGFWGGSVEEGESLSDALVREVREELSYSLRSFRMVGTYSFGYSTKYIYIGEVDENFDTSIDVREGEYGKWFSYEAAKMEPLLDADYKRVLQDIVLLVSKPATTFQHS